MGDTDEHEMPHEAPVLPETVAELAEAVWLREQWWRERARQESHWWAWLTQRFLNEGER